MNLEYRVAELERKQANLLRVGRIKAIHDNKPWAKVIYATEDQDGNESEAVTGWRPWLTMRAGSSKSYWEPEVNEQVMLLSPGGDLAQTHILPAIYQDEFPADHHGPGTLHLHCDVKVYGDVQTVGGDVKADDISLKRHDHVARVGKPV